MNDWAPMPIDNEQEIRKRTKIGDAGDDNGRQAVPAKTKWKKSGD